MVTSRFTEATLSRGKEAMGQSVWCTDQAGPFQTVPHSDPSWRPEGQPSRQPHESLSDGKARILTRFHPADGLVRIEGLTTGPDPLLQGWLKKELTSMLDAMPETKPSPTPRGN